MIWKTTTLNECSRYISRIRNYMSKPWFLKIAMEQEPSSLSAIIAQVLSKDDAPRDVKLTSEGHARL